MRADIHAVQLGAPGIISTELNPSEKLPISVAEERLRRAELSAKRHREMMQLTFKDSNATCKVPLSLKDAFSTPAHENVLFPILSFRCFEHVNSA